MTISQHIGATAEYKFYDLLRRPRRVKGSGAFTEKGDFISDDLGVYYETKATEKNFYTVSNKELDTAFKNAVNKDLLPVFIIAINTWKGNFNENTIFFAFVLNYNQKPDIIVDKKSFRINEKSINDFLGKSFAFQDQKERVWQIIKPDSDMFLLIEEINNLGGNP